MSRITGTRDTFEIAHAGYRFLQSACFRKSNGALTCTTCHNPHQEIGGAAAVEHYVRVCRTCHAGLSADHPASPDCLACHMPKRRTEDVVDAVMTDQALPRRKPAGDLLAPRRELSDADATYQGPVVLLYPPQLPATAETELYLSLAQVIDGAGDKAGIPRLRQAIARSRPRQAYFRIDGSGGSQLGFAD